MHRKICFQEKIDGTVMHRNGLRRKKKIPCSENRCFCKKTERKRAIMHKNEIRHRDLRRMKEVPCTEKRHFHKKIRKLSCSEME
jgi:hypothetical protein